MSGKGSICKNCNCNTIVYLSWVMITSSCNLWLVCSNLDSLQKEHTILFLLNYFLELAPVFLFVVPIRTVLLIQTWKITDHSPELFPRTSSFIKVGPPFTVGARGISMKYFYFLIFFCFFQLHCMCINLNYYFLPLLKQDCVKSTFIICACGMLKQFFGHNYKKLYKMLVYLLRKQFYIIPMCCYKCRCYSWVCMRIYSYKK